ncbi:MAG TPA: ComF family protein [Vicinamibacterales bacterium]|nr:ComF family protein [Vicinamibacterales bacterium]
MGKTQALRDGLDAVLSIALGASCAACGELLEHPTHGPVCAICWRSIAALPPPAFQISSVIDRAQAIGPHDAALRSIVHALKYEGRRSLAVPLAALMRQRCQWALDGAEAAVPVPLHSSRHRERGFNQALDLARALGVPVSRALRRVRRTASQTGLSGSARHDNIRGAFAASRLPWRRRAVRGRIVLLVDDVSTTGATLDECARVLASMGAREVRAVTAARAALSLR